MKYYLKVFLPVIMIISLSACLRSVSNVREETKETAIDVSVSEVSAADLDFTDDLECDLLEIAINRSIRFYQRTGKDRVYRVADKTISSRQLQETLEAFRDMLHGDCSPSRLKKRLAEEFMIYHVTGTEAGGHALFTGYYEPLLDGSLERTEKYRYPLYRVPPDLIVRNGQIGRLQDDRFVSYYSRRDIDVEGVLDGKKLELIWVSDPVKLFSLHIQGSGKIRLGNGNLLTVGFAQTNGRPFRSVIQYMLDRQQIKSQEASYRHDFLNGKSDQEIYDALSYNERYTFFRFLDQEPLGSLGEPVTPGRSIATDPDFFPEGALAFIRLRKPVFDDEENIREKTSFSRFVLSQDKGSAIKGPGRVDLFCGFGKKAELTAGTLKEKGELYLLIKK
jgi:membrane-bound lytic murein transglycosylase A